MTDRSTQDRDDDKRSPYAGWFDLALQMSFTLAISVVALTLGGHWLDKQLGTTPLFLIIGVMWGAGGGIAWVIIRVKRYGDKVEREEKSESEGQTK